MPKIGIHCKKPPIVIRSMRPAYGLFVAPVYTPRPPETNTTTREMREYQA